MTMKKMFTVVGLAILLASCSTNTSYEKTKSGLAYKIIKGKGGAKLKFGDFVKIMGSIKIAPRDSFLFTTSKMAEYLPVDTSSRLSHDFNEVLKLCSVGDSIITVAQVDTLVKRGQANYEGFFKRGDQIVTALRIVKAFAGKDEVMKDQQMEMEKVKVSEVSELQDELNKKGIKTEKTENGVFVETLKAGDTAKVQNGKLVTVNYTGSLMENGKKFDSNTDTTFHHIAPFAFVVGAGQTIKGWEEGILKMGVGGKANLYVPSMLGYGPQGSPPMIPRFAALKFEVEVVKMEEAPAPPKNARPMPQQGANPQQNPQQQPENQTPKSH